MSLPFRAAFQMLSVLLLFPALPRASEVWWPSPSYPAPDRASTPSWLTGRKLTFSRWDGGRIETAKGFLSGWTYFNPPWPDVIDATTRWTDVRTVDLADRMGYNFLWLTFSVGFSIEEERSQWEALRPYVAECHRRGIKVAAYMSSCNLFVDDMFERVPEAKNWLLRDAHEQPVPYGAAVFSKIGRITRQMADITNPEWKDYLKKRIDAAIDLGFDALEYDNTSWKIGGAHSQQQYATFLEKNRFVDTPEARFAFELEVMKRLYPELLAYAQTRKPDIVVFSNINRPAYAQQRGCTLITTEDGKEPGYYSWKLYQELGAEDLLPPLYQDQFLNLRSEPFDPNKLITNLGSLRLLHGLNEGWKPVLVELNGRKNGHRLLNQFAPLTYQLAAAECNAALCSLQGYQEGRALLDLYQRKPEVMRIVAAAGEVNHFVRQHEDLVLDAGYRADVAFVTDDRLEGIDFLAQLARRNIQYDVVYPDRIKENFLRRFGCVVAYSARLISDEAMRELRNYARDGGKLLIFGPTGAMTDWGQPRSVNLLAGAGPWLRAADDPESVLAFIRKNTAPVFTVVDCPYVLFTLTHAKAQPEGAFTVHLLNYQKEPLSHVRIRLAGRGRPNLIALTPGCDQLVEGSAPGEWIIPRLGVYSLLTVEP